MNGYISRGSMTIILSAAGLIMVAFGAFISMQNAAVERRIDDLKAQLETVQGNYLTKSEHGEFKLRIDQDLTRLNQQIVPRTENDVWRKSIDEQLLTESDRLNELRNATTSTYTLHDEITHLQGDIAEMRKQMDGRAR